MESLYLGKLLKLETTYKAVYDLTKYELFFTNHIIEIQITQKRCHIKTGELIAIFDARIIDNDGTHYIKNQYKNFHKIYSITLSLI